MGAKLKKKRNEIKNLLSWIELYPKKTLMQEIAWGGELKFSLTHL
jgi:hypothetical protein